jgi:hypothetical protein
MHGMEIKKNCFRYSSIELQYGQLVFDSFFWTFNVFFWTRMLLIGVSVVRSLSMSVINCTRELFTWTPILLLTKAF